MKKIVLSLLAACLFMTCFSQNYKKNPALGLSYVLFDFKTASDLRTSGIASVLKSKQWQKIRNMGSGFGINYYDGLSDHLDFVGTLSGAFLNYPVPNKPADITDQFLLDATAAVNLKLTTDQYWVSPYITAGVGASKYKGYYGAFLPVGLGIQVNFSDKTYLFLNSQYRIAITENTNYHLYHSFGVASNIFKRKTEPAPVVIVEVPVVEAPKDRDGDGVLDINDKCPDTKGLASLQGCPDRDRDGIADNDDTCPDVPGTAKYKGCPIPDTDGDGINDEQDKCISVKGVARYNGCPVPDTDGDGVNDEEDKCIDKAGPASNSGCPEIPKTIIDKINYAAKNVFFATGSAKLLAKSNKALNDVAAIMNNDKSLMLDIDGHTDNTGKADKNLILSENRAAAVLTYLKSKGVDESRMKSAGHGQDEPVADNKTAAGRAKNRRVELKARNY